MVSVIVINIENKKAPLQKWGFLDFAESLLDTNLSLLSYSMLIFPLSQQYFSQKPIKIENYYFTVTSCRNLSDKDSSLKHSATKKSNSGL